MARMSLLWQAFSGTYKHTAQRQDLLSKCLPSIRLSQDTFVTHSMITTIRNRSEIHGAGCILAPLKTPTFFKVIVGFVERMFCYTCNQSNITAVQSATNLCDSSKRHQNWWRFAFNAIAPQTWQRAEQLQKERNMSKDTTEQEIYIAGKKAAVLRNGGTLCDIRRHGSGFLYSGGYRVAVAEELLESLPDSTILQFTNLDSKDVYTCTVHDFRHWSEPIRFAGYEMQRVVEIVKLNHTIEGGPRKPRKNELQHVDTTPIPEYRQDSFFK